MPTLEQRYDPAFPIAELEEHPDNPRQGDEAAIEESMAAHGFYGSVLVQASTRRILAGNHRKRVAARRGEETLPVLFLDVDDEQARRILLVDNRSNDRAGYDSAELAELLAQLATSDAGLAGTGYGPADLEALLAELDRERAAPEGPPVGRLADQFVVPPFSVLDGRSGYWRERKARWMRWGVRSNEGRAEQLTGAGGLLSAETLMRRGKGGDEALGRAEATEARLSGLRSGEGRADNLLNFSDTVRSGGYEGGNAWGWSGTSIFDPVLAEVMLRWFCPPGGRVADPFCGGSVRGAVASALGLGYAGYDLRPEQVAANEEQADELGLVPRPDWRVGDAREAAWDGPFDVLFTCPPYWSLERYSDDPQDISGAGSVEEFGELLAACLAPAAAALADDSFAVVVLGAMREAGRHPLFDLPGLGLRVLEQLGLMPYNDLVFLTPLASAALRAARNFAQRKPTPVHQRVVIAVKGSPERAVERCGPVQVMEDEALLAPWVEEE